MVRGGRCGDAKPYFPVIKNPDGFYCIPGNNGDVSTQIEKTGAVHINCPIEDFVSDRMQKVITTPAYMLEANPYQVFSSIRNAVKELVDMA